MMVRVSRARDGIPQGWPSCQSMRLRKCRLSATKARERIEAVCCGWRSGGCCCCCCCRRWGIEVKRLEMRKGVWEKAKRLASR